MKVEEALCPLVVKITVLVHGFAGAPDSIAVRFVHFKPVGSPLTDALDAIPVKSIFTGTPGTNGPYASSTGNAASDQFATVTAIVSFLVAPDSFFAVTVIVNLPGFVGVP